MHIDGSTHAWFGSEHARFDLVTLMDDATSTIYYGQFVDEESTETVMAGLRSVIETHGVFCSLYSDRAAHFVCTPKGTTRPRPVDPYTGWTCSGSTRDRADPGRFTTGPRPV